MNRKKAQEYISGRMLEIVLEYDITNSGRMKERLSKEMAFLKYVNTLLDSVEEEEPESEIYEVHYKGYILQQSGYNNHYMIFEDDKMVMHCQCTEKLDQKGAEEAIDFYIELIGGKHKLKGDESNGQ